MAVSSYEPSLARLLVHEGGYTNHPADPGGPTNFGITIDDYRKYVKPAAAADDVKRMTVDQAKAIYRRRYWDALCCDDLPAGVDYAVFDYGVNSGVGRAGKVLRRCLGLTDATWQVTAEVIAAARAHEPARLAGAICDERLRFLKSLKTWDVFGRGWGRRVAEVKSAALALVAGTAAPTVPPPAKPVPVRTAAVGAVSAGAAAQAAGLPLWAVAAIAVAAALGAALAVHFLASKKV